VATGSDSLTGAAPGLRRIAYGLVAVIVVLLVVGAGTGAARSERHGRGAAGRWGISDPGWLLDAGASVLVVAAVAVAAVLVYAFWPGGRRRRREPDEPEIVHQPLPARWWEKAAAIALPLALVGGLVWALIATRSSGGPAAPSPPAAPSLPSGSQAPRADTSAPVIHWWVVAAVVAVVVAMAALLLVLQRRQRRVPADRTQADRRAEVIGALDDSLDALEAEPDSRRAVIAAYARMEGWLARAGVPRAAWEAPFEYLDRVLVELGAPAAIAATLTELFERAKFAPHPVAAAMKRRAIDVLVELRAELGRAA
jgi:hypothetical protein